ncbi:MAG: peptidoglycan DD-metalloendopeptidase family protein [Pseudomonadota bacterium]
MQAQLEKQQKASKMQKRKNNLKVFLQNVRKIFRARNLIIISDHKVDHVPLSGTIQVLIIVAFLGFFSGVSYITGSYMTASSVIKEKEKKIASTTKEKSRINEEMDLLKRDLVRLNENGNELNSYSKFIIGQHADLVANSSDLKLSRYTENNLFGQDAGKLLDKISYLENRVNEIRKENEHLVTAIKVRTEKKMNYLNDIIAMTGLDAESLERAAEADIKDAKEKSLSEIKPKVNDSKTAGQEPQEHGENNQGGPFIPAEGQAINETESELLANVDRLVMINDIVKSLPLAQPLKEYQQMSPFGKRIDPINHRWSMHPGLDMAGASGSRVAATNDGVVIEARRKPAYGNMVDIEHKFGIVTRYAHLSRISVHEGDKVKKGQVIGIQGSTGRSTGEHLHYEVRIEDHPVNPVKFLNAGEYVLEN